MKKILLIATALLLAEPASAMCDLKHLPFGQGIMAVAAKYDNTEELVEERKIGLNRLLVRAKKLCSGLTESSVVDIEFVDNHMAQVTIKNRRSDGTILSISEGNFGDAKGKTNPSHPDSGNFQSVWTAGEVAVIYASRKDNGKHFEFLRLASDNYKSAYNKARKNVRSKDESSIAKPIEVTISATTEE